jgi:hypothetical protein
MAAINDAYRVLRDPGRRAMYDHEVLDLRDGPSVEPRVHAARVDAETNEGETETLPARATRTLPFLLVLAVLGAIFVITAYATTSGRNSDGVGGSPVDNVLDAGSCLAMGSGGIAVETPCSGPHDFVVERLIPFDFACPVGTVDVEAFGSSQRVCVTT